MSWIPVGSELEMWFRVALALSWLASVSGLEAFVSNDTCDTRFDMATHETLYLRYISPVDLDHGLYGRCYYYFQTSDTYKLCIKLESYDVGDSDHFTNTYSCMRVLDYYPEEGSYYGNQNMQICFLQQEYCTTRTKTYAKFQSTMGNHDPINMTLKIYRVVKPVATNDWSSWSSWSDDNWSSWTSDYDYDDDPSAGADSVVLYIVIFTIVFCCILCAALIKSQGRDGEQQTTPQVNNRGAAAATADNGTWRAPVIDRPVSHHNQRNDNHAPPQYYAPSEPPDYNALFQQYETTGTGIRPENDYYRHHHPDHTGAASRSHSRGNSRHSSPRHNRPISVHSHGDQGHTANTPGYVRRSGTNIHIEDFYNDDPGSRPSSRLLAEHEAGENHPNIIGSSHSLTNITDNPMPPDHSNLGDGDAGEATASVPPPPSYDEVMSDVGRYINEPTQNS